MPEQPPTLRDMINDAIDAGRTLDQLEKIAIDPASGKKASRALLSRLRRGEVDRIPYDYHLRAIAVALGKPYETVRRAAIAQWLPLDGGDTDREQLIDDVRRLRDLADKALDGLGDNGGQRGSA